DPPRLGLAGADRPARPHRVGGDRRGTDPLSRGTPPPDVLTCCGPADCQPGNPNNVGHMAAAQGYPTKATASMRKCATRNGSSRPLRANSQPNSIPIAKLPTKAPGPWYRW